MRVESCQGSGNNQGLLLLATLASIRIAQGLNAEQIELLSAFFEVLGDNLALLIAPSWGDACLDRKKDGEG